MLLEPGLRRGDARPGHEGWLGPSVYPGSHPTAPLAANKTARAAGDARFHPSARQVRRKLVHLNVNLTYA